MLKNYSFIAIVMSLTLFGSSILAAEPVKQLKPNYRHSVSKDIAIEHKDLPKEKWLGSKQRLEQYQNEERIATAPASYTEMAEVIWSNLKTNTLAIGLSIGAYLITSRLIIGAGQVPAPARGGRRGAANQPNAAALAAAAAGGGIGAFLLSKQTGDLVEAIKKGLNFKLEYIDAMKLLKTKLFENSAPLLPYLPESLREAVEMIDREIVSALNSGNPGTAGKLFLAREKVFLSMPLFAHPIDSKATPEIEAKFKRVIDRTLPENRATLEGLIHAMEDNSRLHSQRELPDGTPAGGIKTVVFLNGPRGTGKTEFVRDLAVASGFKDACVIKLAELESQFELVGSGYYANEGPTDKAMGKIIKCILEAGVVNPIIFFEEASNTIGAEARRSIMNQSAGEMRSAFKKMAFLEAFKTIFEKDTTSAAYKFASLWNAPFDISRVTFILAGNFPLHKDLSSGGRITNVYFGPLTPEQKSNAAHDELNTQLARLEQRLAPRELIERTFSEKLLQFIIGKDENRFIPGARILKSVVQKSVTHVLHKGNMSEDEIKQYIGYTFSVEDKRDVLERKNDALAIAVSRQERRIRAADFSHRSRILAKVEIARIIEALREAQEQIQISLSESLPEPQAIAAKIEILCGFITEKVAMRDREKYSDDEIETFAIPEQEIVSVLGSLFAPPRTAQPNASETPEG